MTFHYDVSVGTLYGKVEAETEEEALRKALAHAHAQALDVLAGRTWRLRRVDND